MEMSPRTSGKKKPTACVGVGWEVTRLLDRTMTSTHLTCPDRLNGPGHDRTLRMAGASECAANGSGERVHRTRRF